jgi:hypothetical protein
MPIRDTHSPAVHDVDNTVDLVLLLRTASEQMLCGSFDICPETSVPVRVDAACDDP